MGQNSTRENSPNRITSEEFSKAIDNTIHFSTAGILPRNPSRLPNINPPAGEFLYEPSLQVGLILEPRTSTLLHDTQPIPSLLSSSLPRDLSKLPKYKDENCDPEENNISDNEHNYNFNKHIKVVPTIDEILHGKKPKRLPVNIVKGSYDDWDHYTSVQCKLLREDFLGTLRDGIPKYREWIQTGNVEIEAQFRQDLVIYKDVGIVEFFDNVCVMQVKKDDFWRAVDMKLLLPNTLLCISSNDFSTMVLGVLETDEDDEENAKYFKNSMIMVRFLECGLAFMNPNKTYTIIESKAYFGAYEPFLHYFKYINKPLINFQSVILGQSTFVSPPAYLNSKSVYQLMDTTGNSIDVNLLDPSSWPQPEKLGYGKRQLEALRMALTQDLAIIQGPPGTGKTYLGVRIVDILVKNFSVWYNGSPILVVCQTNHATDQFLEGILKLPGMSDNKNFVVRIGRQSKSSVLEQHKLFNFRERIKEMSGRSNQKEEKKVFSRAGSAYYQRRIVLSKIDEASEYVRKQFLKAETAILDENELFSYMSSSHYLSLKKDFPFYNGTKIKSIMVEWVGSHLIKTALLTNQVQNLSLNNYYSRTTSSLPPSSSSSVDLLEEQWQDLIAKHLKAPNQMDETHVKQVQNVWELDGKARWKLYHYWLSKWKDSRLQKLKTLEQEYRKVNEQWCIARGQRDSFLLSKYARVIGMTTTGAAYQREMLYQLEPTIVIVEEAAELLESHIVTSLTNGCKHLILIGDHKQLRPKVQSHKLEVENKMCVSFFERMILNDVPHTTLNLQYRMRPRIAEMLVPHIYSELLSAPNVHKYSEIRGVWSNLFFITHNFEEATGKYSTSFKNYNEAKFVVQLCKYFLDLGYKSSQITIITGYADQKYLLKSLIKEALKDSHDSSAIVRITTIDDFQGEENDIILLSLVRSNTSNKIGFLNIENRVCVALSRARKGLYAFGNFSLLKKMSPVWNPIIRDMERDGLLDNTLRLFCPNHPKIVKPVRKAADFSRCKCTLPCPYIYPDCRHQCKKPCGHEDPTHVMLKCQKCRQFDN